MTTHPKAVEAQARKQVVLEQRATIKLAKKNDNVRFLKAGDYTICYRLDGSYNGRKHEVIELSTSLRHPKDPNDNRKGQWLALLRFKQNSRILVRRPSDTTVKRFLTDTFTSY